MGTPSKCMTILLHAVHDYPGGKTAAIALHVSFARMTCRPWHRPVCRRMHNEASKVLYRQTLESLGFLSHADIQVYYFYIVTSETHANKSSQINAENRF